MKDESRELLGTMQKVMNNSENCFSLLQNAFIHNSIEPLIECASKVDAIKTEALGLGEKVASLVKEDKDLGPYVSVPRHLALIGEGIGKIAELLEKKVKDKTLFSEKAVTELTFLLQRITDILRPASAIISGKDLFLNRYIQESEKAVVRRSMEYATLHEERLVEGLCLPAASSLYVGMLDSIKSIAWHAKEIVDGIVDWMLPKA